MRVEWNGDVGLRDEQAAGHAEMNEELRGLGLVGTADIGDDGFADAADAADFAVGEGFGELGFGGFEGLGLAAGPDAKDALTADAGVDSVSDGFYFGELGHSLRILPEGEGEVGRDRRAKAKARTEADSLRE